MIIKCRKCETTFRFEDQLMTGEGVWVRCSRCRNEFFQDNPLWCPEPLSTSGPERTEIRDREEIGDPAAAKDEAGRRGREEREASLPSRVKEIRDIMAAEPETIVLKAPEFEYPEAPATEESVMELFKEAEEPATPAKKPKFAAVGSFFAYLFLALSIVILLGGLYLWLFPESKLAVNFFSSYFPGAKGFGKTTDSLAGRIALQDVRQHYVNNWLLGNLRVLEGAAVNTSDFSLTNVQVRGRVYDGAGKILGERVSLCGNLITDAELATLTEEEIQKKLTQPQGGDPGNDRLSPRSQLPFMVVIAHEQPGAVKTTVMVAGAEKLLE